jgi:hypothetical protein
VAGESADTNRFHNHGLQKMLSGFASRRALVAIVFVWMASSSAQATIINTIPSNLNDLVPVGSFGYGTAASATFGQTITVPTSDDVLTTFSFEMRLPGVPTVSNTLFRGYVFAWDNALGHATGDALFTSDIVDQAMSSFQLITFVLPDGGKTLKPNESYVLFASIKGLSGAGRGDWGGGPDLYQGGEFVFLNGVDWTTSHWVPSMTESNPLGRGGDLAFSATFASEQKPIPEPGSLPLLGGAAIAAVAAALRRRRN